MSKDTDMRGCATIESHETLCDIALSFTLADAWFGSDVAKLVTAVEPRAEFIKDQRTYTHHGH